MKGLVRKMFSRHTQLFALFPGREGKRSSTSATSVQKHERQEEEGLVSRLSQGTQEIKASRYRVCKIQRKGQETVQQLLEVARAAAQSVYEGGDGQTDWSRQSQVQEVQRKEEKEL